MTKPGIFLMVCVACSCREAPPPVLDDLPAAPAAVLEGERTVARPPVKDGEVRLTALDIDMPLPPDASVRRDSAGAFLNWTGCAVYVSVAGHAPSPELLHGPRVTRHVGTFDIECVAGPWARNAADPLLAPDARCLAVCDRMRPVPGGTAEEQYPTDPPVIELEASGGFGGRHRGTLVWRDGTTQFYGSGCPAWRGRRATLPAARVEALLRSLDGGGFFAYHHDASKWPHCSDAIHETITARLGDKHNSISFEECSRRELALFAQRLDQAIGRNPCSGY